MRIVDAREVPGQRRAPHHIFRTPVVPGRAGIRVQDPQASYLESTRVGLVTDIGRRAGLNPELDDSVRGRVETAAQVPREQRIGDRDLRAVQRVQRVKILATVRGQVEIARSAGIEPRESPANLGRAAEVKLLTQHRGRESGATQCEGRGGPGVVRAAHQDLRIKRRGELSTYPPEEAVVRRIRIVCDACPDQVGRPLRHIIQIN